MKRNATRNTTLARVHHSNATRQALASIQSQTSINNALSQFLQWQLSFPCGGYSGNGNNYIDGDRQVLLVRGSSKRQEQNEKGRTGSTGWFRWEGKDGDRPEEVEEWWSELIFKAVKEKTLQLQNVALQFLIIYCSLFVITIVIAQEFISTPTINCTKYVHFKLSIDAVQLFSINCIDFSFLRFNCWNLTNQLRMDYMQLNRELLGKPIQCRQGIGRTCVFEK